MKQIAAAESSFEEFETLKISRRKLLPWWIKVFCWIFMIFGMLSIFLLILGFFDITVSIGIYGFKANKVFSINGIIVIAVFIYKGFTGLSLWQEKDNAIQLGQIDAVIGFILCAISMFILPIFQDEFNITFRLDLVLLIVFFVKLNKIQNEWEGRK